MPDYTSILKRSVSTLPDQSPAMREAVYQRARAALARQLTVVDPPLSTREIEAQHQELENAVREVEAGFTKPSTPAQSTVPSPSGSSSSPSFSAHSASTQRSTSSSPAAPSPSSRLSSTQPPVSKPKDEQVLSDALRAPSVVPAAAKPGERDFFFKETRPKRDAGAAPTFADESDTAADEFEDADPFYEEERRPSRLPLLLAILAVVVVFGGIGTFFYTQGGDLLGWIGGEEEATVASTESPEPDAGEIDDTDAKRLDA